MFDRDLLVHAQSLGVKELVLHTAYPPAPPHLCPFDDAHFSRLLLNHIEAVDWWFESLLAERPVLVDVYFNNVLLALLHGAGVGTSGGGCPAGIQDFSIAPDGSVYSCHLLYRVPEFRLGNILTDDNLPTEAGLPIRNIEIPECVDCHARHRCQTCGALNLSWGDAWTVPLRECTLRRAVVLRIGELAFRHLDIPSNPATDVLRQAVLHVRGVPAGRAPLPRHAAQSARHHQAPVLNPSTILSTSDASSESS